MNGTGRSGILGPMVTAAIAWSSRGPKLHAIGNGLPPAGVAPYIINADPALPACLPQGGETVADLANRHLGHAVACFALAILPAGVLIWQRRRDGRGPPSAQA